MTVDTEDGQTETLRALLDLLHDSGTGKQGQMPSERIEVREPSGIRNLEDEDPLARLSRLVDQLDAGSAGEVSLDGRTDQRETDLFQNRWLDARAQDFSQVTGRFPGLFEGIEGLIEANRRRGRGGSGNGLKEIRQRGPVERNAALLHSRTVDPEEDRRCDHRQGGQDRWPGDAGRRTATDGRRAGG